MFVSLGGTGARVSSAGTCEVQAITLDEALDGIAPTYMKFDIEGSEPDALEGGRETLRVIARKWRFASITPQITCGASLSA